MVRELLLQEVANMHKLREKYGEHRTKFSKAGFQRMIGGQMELEKLAGKANFQAPMRHDDEGTHLVSEEARAGLLVPPMEKVFSHRDLYVKDTTRFTPTADPDMYLYKGSGGLKKDARNYITLTRSRGEQSHFVDGVSGSVFVFDQCSVILYSDIEIIISTSIKKIRFDFNKLIHKTI